MPSPHTIVWFSHERYATMAHYGITGHDMEEMEKIIVNCGMAICDMSDEYAMFTSHGYCCQYNDGCESSLRSATAIAADINELRYTSRCGDGFIITVITLPASYCLRDRQADDTVTTDDAPH